jgi:alkylation response protein AidB-like acyl-CoA dehydrogenase
MLKGSDLRKASAHQLVCGGWYRQYGYRIQWVCITGALGSDWAVYAMRTGPMAEDAIAARGSKLGSAVAFALTGADEDAKSLYRY